MGESKSRMVQKQRERYSDIAMTDLDALNAAEIELQQMKRRRAEALKRLVNAGNAIAEAQRQRPAETQTAAGGAFHL